jgi:hypothetical protein
MYNELKAVKSAVIDLSLLSTTKTQASALLKLKIKLANLEECIDGKEHYECNTSFKDGM